MRRFLLSAMRTSPIRELQRPGSHERRISALFGGRTRFRGDGPIIVRPLLILGFTNRSGSHLLGDYLLQTGQIAGLGEFCNHDVVVRMQDDHPVESFPAHIAALSRRIGPQSAFFGVKLSWEQIAMFLRWNIPAMFQRTVLIHIRREDLVAQAVSHSIARQKQVWTSQQTDTRMLEPAFRPDEIGRTIAETSLANERIRQLAAAAEIPRIAVSYEELLGYPSLHLARLVAFCGLDCPEFRPSPPRFERQSGPHNARFISAYEDLVRRAVLSGEE